MLDLGTLVVKLRGDPAPFAADMAAAQTALSGVASEARRTGASFSTFDDAAASIQAAQGALVGLGVAAAGVAVGGAAAIASWAQAAGDVAEQLSYMQVLFGDLAPSVEAFANATAASTGRSVAGVRAMAVELGGLTVTLTGSAEAGAKMAQALTQLAIDVGSARNIPEALALEKLRAGLIGSAEPMLSLGVDMRVASLDAWALSKGLSAMKDMSAEQQAITRFDFMVEKLARDSGDAARTIDSYSNSIRAADGAIKDAQVSLGDAFLPILTDVAKEVRSLAIAFAGLDPSTKTAIAGTTGVAVALAAVTAAGVAFLAFVPGAVTGFGLLTTAATTTASALGGALLSHIYVLTLAVPVLGAALWSLASGALVALAAAFYPITIAAGAVALSWGLLEAAGVDVTGALRRDWQSFTDWFEETWDRITGKQLTAGVEQARAAAAAVRALEGTPDWFAPIRGSSSGQGAAGGFVGPPTFAGSFDMTADARAMQDAAKAMGDFVSGLTAPSPGPGTPGTARASAAGGSGRGSSSGVADEWAEWRAVLDGWVAERESIREELASLDTGAASLAGALVMTGETLTRASGDLTGMGQAATGMVEAFKAGTLAVRSGAEAATNFASALGESMVEALDAASVAVSAIVDAVSTGDLAVGLAVFATRLLQSSEGFAALTAALDTSFIGLANILGAVLEPVVPLVRAFGALFNALEPVVGIIMGPTIWGLQLLANGLVIVVAGVAAFAAGLFEAWTQIGNIFTGDADFGKIAESAGEAFNRTMLASAGMASESLYGLGESSDVLRRSTDDAAEALDTFAERLLNAPAGYRVARAQYAAQDPMLVMPVRIYTWEGYSGGN